MSSGPGRHVEHKLAALVSGQLSPRQAQRVLEHVRQCPACRERLARHERLAADLRLTLGQAPRPRAAEIGAWWRLIVARRHRPPRAWHGLPAALPALLSLLMLLAPLIVGPGQATARAASSPVGYAPLLAPTLEVVTASRETAATPLWPQPAVTTPGVNPTPLPPLPAPLAPTSQQTATSQP